MRSDTRNIRQGPTCVWVRREGMRMHGHVRPVWGRHRRWRAQGGPWPWDIAYWEWRACHGQHTLKSRVTHAEI